LGVVCKPAPLALVRRGDYERAAMERAFTIARTAVLALFLIVTAGVVGYQMLYVWPQQKCDREGLWWDPRDRQCLTPIPIERFTGRNFGAYKVMPASPLAPTAHPPAPGR
jgi:hypothetical protein